MRYALYDVDVEQRARRRHAERAVRARPASTTSTSRSPSATCGRCRRTRSTRRACRSRAAISKAYSTDLVGPQVTISGVATFGTFSSSPTRRENTLFQVVNNLSHRAGAHALRAGVDFLYNDDTITFLRTFRGSYTFSSLANFLAGQLQRLRPDVRQSGRHARRIPTSGIYAQDEWRAGSRLTLNLGLRYDLQFLETINTDTNNVSPRVGFVWAPTRVAGLPRARRRRPLLRSRAAARRRQRAALGGQHHRRHASCASRRCRASCRRRPARRSSRTSCPTACRRRRSSRSRRWTRICRTPTRSRPTSRSSGRSAAAASLTVGYQYFRGENLLMSINQNVPTCVAAGTNNGCRPVSDLHEQQPVPRRRRLELSRAARHLSCSGRATGRRSASPTRCRSR